jgi:hypothetical protein
MKYLFLILIAFGTSAAATHAWVKVPKADLAVELFKHRLPESDYSVVAASQLSSAIEHLSRMPFIHLSETKVKKYTPDLRFDSKKEYYLVRGVIIDGGRLSVYSYKNSLYVYSGALGSSGIFHRSALVIASDVCISDVYVNYSIAK